MMRLKRARCCQWTRQIFLKDPNEKSRAIDVLADNLFEGVKESQRVSFMFGHSVIFA